MHVIRSFDFEPSTVTDMLLSARLIPVTPWLNDALVVGGELPGLRDPDLIEIGGFRPADAAASLCETGDLLPDLGGRAMRSVTLKELIGFSRAEPDAQKQGLVLSLRACRIPRSVTLCSAYGDMTREPPLRYRYPYLGYFGPRTLEARRVQEMLSPDSVLGQRFIGLWHPNMPLPDGARALVIKPRALVIKD